MANERMSPAAVPVPQLTGPLPDTDSAGVGVWDVSKFDYEALEYVLTGVADIYEPVAMADAHDSSTRDTTRDLGRRSFELKKLKSAQDYRTRLVVYRPRDPARFSGNVIVESFHTLGGGTGVVWNSIHDFFIANGDAYVGFQHPSTVEQLKRTGGARYAALQMSDPTQLWDGLAQTAALLKSAVAHNPLHGYRVRYLFLTGISFTGVATSTFANFHHDIKKTADGSHLFDGYVSMENGTYDRPIDVPVMKVNTQGDFDSFGGLANRRADGDEPGGQYRLYEVPGWPHVSAPRSHGRRLATPPRVASSTAQNSAASEWLRTNAWAQFPEGAQPNDFPGHAFASAAFHNMYAWVRGERLPPRAERIETHPDGTTHYDALGNARGGVRSPYLDVPIAKYGVGSGYPGFLFGYKLPLPLDRRRALHGDHAQYVQRVREHARRLVDQRFVLDSDAHAIVDEAERSEHF